MLVCVHPHVTCMCMCVGVYKHTDYICYETFFIEYVSLYYRGYLHSLQ